MASPHGARRSRTGSERKAGGPAPAEDRLMGAAVVLHLGSAGEISTALVERGLAGGLSGPQRDQAEAVWRRWDAMTPQEQRAVVPGRCPAPRGAPRHHRLAGRHLQGPLLRRAPPEAAGGAEGAPPPSGRFVWFFPPPP